MVDLQPMAVEALHLLPAASRHADRALNVLDCQEWAKRPLAASGARWTNRGGWHGRERRLNWKGRGMWGGRRRVLLSCHSVVVSSLGPACDVSQLLGG